MSVSQPRHPIMIIGAGIAGLAAGYQLEQLGIPYQIYERFPRPGGRLNSRTGKGWIADHGCPWIMQTDTNLTGFIRSVGMELNRVAIQGGVLRLKADRTIETPKNGGVDMRRICLDLGFADFISKFAAHRTVVYDKAIGAIRWDNDEKVFWWDKEGQVFWFEDEAGEPVRDELTKEVIMASGVILATTATAATKIARKSRSLEALVPTLSGVQLSGTFAGIYKVPRMSVPYYALQGDRESRISLLAFEDNKAPERADREFSLMVVHSGRPWSAQLLALSENDALVKLYNEAKLVIPELPPAPIEMNGKKWNVAQLATAPIGQPWENGMEGNRWPINPSTAPFALAGDYVYGARAEDAARSGVDAANFIAKQLPTRRRFLGLELPA